MDRYTSTGRAKREVIQLLRKPLHVCISHCPAVCDDNEVPSTIRSNGDFEAPPDLLKSFDGGGVLLCNCRLREVLDVAVGIPEDAVDGSDWEESSRW